MKTNFLIFSILVACIQLYAQEKIDRLSIEFGYDYNNYKMEKLNEFYTEPFTLNNNIKSGQHFRLGLSYKPLGLFDFGIYGSYQYGNVKTNPVIKIRDDYGFPVGETSGNYELKTEAFAVGISTTWYISHLLKFQEKTGVFSDVHLGIELNGGLGFSNIISNARFCDYPQESSYSFYTDNRFQSQFGLKVEYDFIKSPVFTTLGVRAGYQYFKTKTVKDKMDNDWVVGGEHPINLDFSGFYFGTYLKIGK